MTPAQLLTNQVRLAVTAIGSRLFPTTVGKFWSGHVVGRLENGDVVLRNARIVNVGLTGMSDLIGPTPMTITAADVGRTVAIYTAVEVKAGADRMRAGQSEFIDMVKKMGGRAGVARTPDDGVKICRGG